MVDPNEPACLGLALEVLHRALGLNLEEPVVRVVPEYFAALGLTASRLGRATRHAAGLR
jgi:hypothetical protein